MYFSDMMKDMPNSVKDYYESWYKSANKQLQHPNDWERFYLFVSLLFKKSRKRRDAEWFRNNLTVDCPEFGASEIEKLSLLFEHLQNFYLINNGSLRTYYWDKVIKGVGVRHP